MTRAFFGPPRVGPSRGGMQVTVHLVPVLDGRLVVFDVTANVARGRWLPWAVLDYQQNPYEAASLLADDWCDVPLDDLSLVDVLSLEAAGGGWELAVVFRAVLTTLPAGDSERHPIAIERGHSDAIGAFDPVDLERWVGEPTADASEANARLEPGPRLVF